MEGVVEVVEVVGRKGWWRWWGGGGGEAALACVFDVDGHVHHP